MTHYFLAYSKINRFTDPPWLWQFLLKVYPLLQKKEFFLKMMIIFLLFNYLTLHVPNIYFRKSSNRSRISRPRILLDNHISVEACDDRSKNFPIGENKSHCLDSNLKNVNNKFNFIEYLSQDTVHMFPIIDQLIK